MKINPLIADTTLETVQNVTEAMASLVTLLSHEHSDLARLMTPMLHALEYEAAKK